MTQLKWTLALLMLFSTPPLTHAYTASKLRDDCRIANHVDQMPRPSYTDFMSTGLCFGYIRGFLDTHATTLIDNKLSTFMVNPNVEPGQISEMFVKYLDEHPKHLDMPAAFAIMAALLADNKAEWVPVTVEACPSPRPCKP